MVLIDIPLCLGDTLADWLQAGGLILGVDGLREDTARYLECLHFIYTNGHN